MVPLEFQGQHNLERVKGQYFHRVSEEGKQGRLLWRPRNSRKDPGTSEETIPEGQAGVVKKRWMKNDRKAVLGKSKHKG